MTDVFLSYKRDDRAVVAQLAATLRDLGFAVWFDTSLSPGEVFSDEIDRQLQSCSAVLVCWSPTATQSNWVKGEALKALDKHKLVACQVVGEGALELPTPFNSVHAENLEEWLKSPNATDPAWKNVLRRLGKLCNRTDVESWGVMPANASAGQLRDWISANEESPLLIAADATLRARERVDAVQAAAEREAQARRTEAEAVVVSLKRIEEKKRSEAEAIEKQKRDRKERGARSFGAWLFGTVLAIPIFFIVYAVVAAAAFAGILLLQWLNLDRTGNGITRMAELIAAAASGYFGVQVARHAVDAVVKSWSGWPTFLLLLAVWGAALYYLAARTDLSNTWWLLVLEGLHAAIAVSLGFLWIARKGHPG